MTMLSNKSNYILFFNFGKLFICAIFAFAYIEKNPEKMYICGLFFLLIEVVSKAFSFYKNIAYILFLLSFFVFLQGRYLINIILTGKMLSEFSVEIAVHINVCIFVSLIFLCLGYYLSSKVKFKFRIRKNVSGKTNTYINTLRMKDNENRALTLFYCSSCFAIVSQIDTFIFVRNNSYLDYYLNYTSHVPRLLQVFGNMYIVFFIIFLCTYPQKDKCRIPIRLFFIISILVLLTGDRGGFIQNISILIVYCLWRQRKEREVWIKPSIIILGIAVIPIIMALLSSFVYFREGLDIGAVTLSAQLQRFLLISGRSANILGYAKKYQNMFPLRFYSFGGLIDYIKYNPISKAIFGFQNPLPQTKEFALNMHSFDSALSYFVYPQTYFNGHGIGSCYLAEVYFDFGYIGIIIISLIYAFLLNKCDSITKESITIQTIVLLSIRGLFYAPRGPALIFITIVLNITTITALVIYHLVGKLKVK